MSNLSEVKTIFTVDLTAFVDGLKTMLSMTAATGAQLKPLLSVDAKIPNYSSLETQLKGLADRTKDYLKANQDSAAETGVAVTGEKDHEIVVNKATTAVDKKSNSLRGVRRESHETLMAVGFLAVGISQLTAGLGDGTTKLEKMTKGFSEGASAGIGLAMLFQTIPGMTGPVAIGLGAVVAVGMTVAKMFDDSAEKAKQSATAMDMWTASLKGETKANLEELHARLTQKVIDSEKDAKTTTSQNIVMGALSGAMSLLTHNYQPLVDAQKRASGSTEQLTRDKMLLAEVDKILAGTEKSYAETSQYVQEKLNASIVDEFAKRRQAAMDERDKELENNVGNAAALKAIWTKYYSDLKQIEAGEAARSAQLQQTKNEIQIELIKRGMMTRQAAETQINIAVLSTQETQLQKELANLVDNYNKEIITDQQYAQKKAEIDLKITQNANAQIAARIADEKFQRQEIQRSSDLEFEQVKNRLQQRLILEGKTEEQINIAVLARQKMRIQAELGILNQKKALNEDERKSKEKLETDLTALDLKATQDKKAASQTRIEMLQQEIEMGMQQEDAAVHTGEAINRSVNSAIKAYISKAVAAALASVFESIPFPFSLIAAAAAGPVVTALLDGLIPKFAQGTPPGGFVVPPGYNDDNYLIGVSSGEKVHVQSALRNTYMPTINRETMSAPAAIRQQDLQDAAVAAMRAQIELSNQSGNAMSIGNKMEVHIYIDHYIGTQEYFEKYIKPSVEKGMRTLGASSVMEVFLNTAKQNVKLNA
jgi:hypothetical protein